MIRRLVLGLALALMLPAAAMAQPVTQTGAVQTPGGQPLQLTPTTQFNQSCNSGAGGIVGQTYNMVVCGPAAGTVTIGAGSAVIGKVGIDQTTPGTTNAVVCSSGCYPATQPVSDPPGATSVTGSISSATQSSTFTPTPRRIFHVTLSGTWTGSCQLERQLGGSWFTLTTAAAGSVIQLEYWTAGAAASDDWVESGSATAYRIDCGSGATGGGWASGTINYRFDQA